MKKALLGIMLLLITPAISQVISIGGCAPYGDPSCDVSFSGFDGAIGCNCTGTCTNGNRVAARAIVSWHCAYPQFAYAHGNAYPGSSVATASAGISGPGSPIYETYEEWNDCNSGYGFGGGISGIC